MPLDVAISVDQRWINLERAALKVGIIPLPVAVLEAHKATELAKNPGSLVSRYPGFFRMGCAAGMLVALTAGLGLRMLPSSSMSFMHFAISEMFVVAVIIGILVVSAVQFKGPAEWQSSFREELGNDIPAPFRDMAEAIRHEVPECQAEVGELMRNKVVLDPYLVIHHRLSPRPIVIGIWDRDRIVASATRIQV